MIPPPGNSYTEFIDQRIRQAGVKRKVKDDAIKMVSFVMTSDKDFFDGMPTEAEHAFFTDCVNFVKKRYGEENIVSAVVHKDETTPHLHINFVPITPDNRLSAKYYFDGKLAELQAAVYEEVGKKWNLSRGKVGSAAKHVDPKTYHKVVRQATADARAENEDLKEANATAREYLDRTIRQMEQVRTERDKIIAERDKEADYSQALEEAKWVKEHLKDKKVDLPIVYDCEEVFLEDEESRLTGIDKVQLTANTIAFLEEMKKSGYEVMVYTYQYWADTYYEMDKIAAYPIWFAQYDTDSPKLEYPIRIWQYSNQGTISGIKEPTDLNIMFIQKNDQPE